MSGSRHKTSVRALSPYHAEVGVESSAAEVGSLIARFFSPLPFRGRFLVFLFTKQIARDLWAEVAHAQVKERLNTADKNQKSCFRRSLSLVSAWSLPNRREEAPFKILPDDFRH